ncbi:hypothetical protein TUBRATIS_003640 [Tubulinosema ratisbonensis]|uniref:Uncharacterized protein n=1 Tax=Tubulinosema ratisbonensis TaxID=291195 RepID=A0A437APJ2_9MICR|nr:hypothetical protein TUBRATIS_003640 [Tubulinosema ratisbonensis]
MNFSGLTEICGKPGIGKTKLSLLLSLNHNTLYISSKNINITKITNQHLFLIQIFYLKDLLFLFEYKIEPFIKLNQINLIIIDSLEHLIISEEINRILYLKVKKLFFTFKKIIYFYKLKIIVVNNLFEKKIIGWMHKIFGIRYFYNLNTRIVLFKVNSLLFVKKTLCLDDKVCKRAYIDDRGMVFVKDE